MTRPVPDPGNKMPKYTREAVEAQSQGVMLVKCTITVEGNMKNCRVIKPVRFMNDVVLEVLSEWKFQPATRDGQAIAVDYVIPVRCVIPAPPPTTG